MACHKSHICVGEIVHASALRYDVADEFVILLQPALLIRLVRITEEYTSPSLAIWCHLDGPRILELCSIVS